MKIFPYYQKFPKSFKKKGKEIAGINKDAEVHHIGSTAVKGLGGKGIIDIMIGVGSWQGIERLVAGLNRIGFNHIHPKERGKIFLSTQKESKLGDCHIHIVRRGSAAYRNFLAFRDYLRKYSKEAERYFALKLFWYKQSKGKRAKYTQMKSKYIKEVLKKARQEYAGAHY